ncbi:MAG: hypothetical protein ACK4JE_04510, partial [Endomicrobiia bacterium]
MKFRYFVLIFLLIVISIIFILLKFIPKFSEKYIMDYLALHNIKLYSRGIILTFPNCFTIMQPTLTKDQTELSSKEIIFYFDWLKFLKKRNLTDSFYKVFLVEPKITLKEQIQLYNLKPPIEKTPEINIEWKNGDLILTQPNVKFNSKYGKIGLTKEINSAELDFSLSESSEKFKLKYISDNNTKNWNAKLIVKENRYLPDYSLELNINGDKEYKGKFSFSIQDKNLKDIPFLSGIGNFSIAEIENDVLLTANISNLNLTINNENFSGSSKITYLKKKLSLENLILTEENTQQKISASGSLSEKIIDLKIKTEKIKIENFSKKFKGELNSEISIYGEIGN